VQGEALRLAYVALTRARHQTVLHWASSWDSRQSPLARLLFASDIAPDAVELATPPDESDVVARVQAIAARAPGTIAIESTGGPGADRWTPATSNPQLLEVRRLDRS